MNGIIVLVMALNVFFAAISIVIVLFALPDYCVELINVMWGAFGMALLNALILFVCRCVIDEINK